MLCDYLTDLFLLELLGLGKKCEQRITESLGLPSGLKVRRAKSAAKNPKITECFF